MKGLLFTYQDSLGIVNRYVSRESRARRLAWLRWLGGTELKIPMCGSGLVRFEFPTVSGAGKLSNQNTQMGAEKEERDEAYKLSANRVRPFFYNSQRTLPMGVYIFVSFSSVQLFLKFL